MLVQYIHVCMSVCSLLFGLQLLFDQFMCYDALDNGMNAHSYQFCIACVCPVVFSTIHAQKGLVL